jgi:hypothetical protein
MMDPRKLFADERHAGKCVFCGALPETREHVASRVLLDEPFPDDLPLVESCHVCNNGVSRDEEYLACLIECVICGSTNPDKVSREKVRASLRHSPALAVRIEASRTQDAAGRLVWKPEDERVRRVVVKLARGHAAHQYSEPQLAEPERVVVVPLMALSPERRAAFEEPPDTPGWPEIGSRAFVNLLEAGDKVFDPESGWGVQSAGRYRYLVAQPGETVVRIVLSEYLACEVVW